MRRHAATFVGFVRQSVKRIFAKLALDLREYAIPAASAKRAKINELGRLGEQAHHRRCSR
ncbi:MAG: hypothetical protein ABSF67_09365 [Roseiarcus sp.]|jgi:hypothetical protein